MRQAREWMRIAGFAFGSASACGLLAVGPATAIEFRGGQHVVVDTDEVILDDLYVTGETVTVNGRVEGDMIASGQQVWVNGEVTGDLMAAAQVVVVNGRVGDDVRMAGMALQLGDTASVGDDIVAAGFSLETAPGSRTLGSLFYAGFQTLLAGEIDGGFHGSMNAVEIRGGIGDSSEIEVGGDPNTPSFAQYIPSPVALPSVEGGLTIADTARIAGGLEYTSSNEARGSGLDAGTLTRKEPASVKVDSGNATRRPSWPGKLFKGLGLIVLGLLLAWWIPEWLNDRSGEISSRPLLLAGVGFIGVAALPVGIVLALVVLVLVAFVLGLLELGSLAALALVLGLVGLALLVLLFWLTSSYLAPILVGLCTGRWVLERFSADRARGLVLPLVAGVAVLALLRFAPFLGLLVALAVLLLGWGAMLLWLWRWARPAKAAV